MLTEVQVKGAKPREKAYKLRDERGLYLLVTPAGGRLWRLRYWLDGKESMLSLGAYPDVSLREARTARDEARKLVAKKKNPAVARRAEKASRADTFGSVAEEWRGKQGGLSANTQRLMDWQLGLILPKLGARPVAEISAHEVLGLLHGLEDRGRSVAKMARQRIGQILRYAAATERLEHDVTSKLRGALTIHTQKKHPGLTRPQEVGELLRRIERVTGEPGTAYCLRILPHVFLRPSELRQARWDWVQGGEMHCPDSVMKMRRPHLVPLSPQVLALLEELRGISGDGTWMFPGARADCVGHGILNQALRRLGYTRDQQTAHGLRTTASTLLNGLGWHPDWIEMQLAHADGSVRGVYNEAQWLPERTAMMRAWSDYLESLAALGRDGAPVDVAALERAALRGRPATHASTSLLYQPVLPPRSSTA